MNKAQFEQQDKLQIWKYNDSIVIHVFNLTLHEWRDNFYKYIKQISMTKVLILHNYAWKNIYYLIDSSKDIKYCRNNKPQTKIKLINNITDMLATVLDGHLWHDSFMKILSASTCANQTLTIKLGAIVYSTKSTPTYFMYSVL